MFGKYSNFIKQEKGNQKLLLLPFMLIRQPKTSFTIFCTNNVRQNPTAMPIDFTFHDIALKHIKKYEIVSIGNVQLQLKCYIC